MVYDQTIFQNKLGQGKIKRHKLADKNILVQQNQGFNVIVIDLLFRCLKKTYNTCQPIPKFLLTL